MKKSIVLYLFILAVLFNIFTYMYYTKKSGFDREQSALANKKLRDSLSLMVSKYNDANYFALETNQDAQDYFENKATGKYYPYDKLIPYVTDKLKSFNDDPKGNPYVGFDKMGAQKFIINKAKLLNHRWIIADFSNGELWGEAIIKYFINDDETVSFETAETFLYPKQ